MLLLTCGVSTGAAIGFACSERTEDPECYPRDASLDYEDPQMRLNQTCGWKDGLPEPPEGYDHTWTVNVAFEPTDDEPCAPCDVERLDALLKAKIEERCDQPYTGFTRGCYIPVEEDGKYCWVEGIYYSSCLANEMQ